MPGAVTEVITRRLIFVFAEDVLYVERKRQDKSLMKRINTGASLCKVSNFPTFLSLDVNKFRTLIESYIRNSQSSATTCTLLALRVVSALEESKIHFERAIALDPGFAAAIVGLANAYHLLYEYAGWPEAESLEPAMILLEEAIELSPDLGEAFMVRGEIHRHHDELDSAASDFERAMELIPGNATLFNWFSFVRAAQGREDESYALLQRAHSVFRQPVTIE